jgi:dsRNA-specific ribonuclease
MADANLNNPVGDLQERCVRDNLPLPIYTKMKKDGPEHSPTFTQKVTVLNYVAFGTGKKYQKAKYDAARKMIAILDNVSSPQSSKGSNTT